MANGDQRHITQHKRFVVYGVYPNSAFGGALDSRKTLSDILLG